jgi:uncharacterized protein (TIGR02099 family)
MPMLNSLPVRVIRHSLSWLLRLTVIVSAATAALTALAIILLRYWFLPDIDQYRDIITASFSEATGSNVTVGKIEGEWQGLHPHLNFTGVRVLDEQGQPVLALDRVDTVVSWASLFSAELRLSSLEVNRPELLIRRNAQGKYFLGNVALSEQAGQSSLDDWLLSQAHMVVRDALIVWVDEQRDAPPLVLRQVNVHIDNALGRHRFALRALPPEDLATPLDVRGDFYGASFDDLSKWNGQIFAQFYFIDAAAWRHWLDIPKEWSSGRGAVRSWLNVKAGSASEIIADLALYNVVAKLADDAREMLLPSLRCRVTWNDVVGGYEVSVKNLAMRLREGTELQSTDVYFRTTKAINNQPATNEVRANLLQFEWFTRTANYLPLEAGVRAQLEAYSPTGKVTNLNVQWQGKFEKPDSYKIKGQFENIALRQVGTMPGFSGLSLEVDGTDTSGTLNINSRRLVVNAPGMMREPLFFTLLIGQAGWQRERNELKITLDNASVVNDDLAGGLYGSYQTQAGTLGILDLNASLTRGDVRKAARYTPLIALNMEGSNWLNGALLAGHTEDFHIRVKGNLSDFPLDGTKDALLEIGGHAKDVVMEFDKNWPRIENIAGEFLIRGNKLEVKASSATILGADLRNVTVTLPDMMSDDLPLEINGEAAGENSAFLQFIQESPVRGYIGGFTDSMSASSKGHLDLFARIPLRGDKPVKVSGAFRVQDSEIFLGPGVPLLRKTRGELTFTESGMRASDLVSEILGGPAIINMQTGENGAVQATVQGQSRIDALRRLHPLPLLDHLHGGTTWNAKIVVAQKSAQLEINSNLQGIKSSLPQPFSKDANKTMHLRVTKENITDKQDLVTVQLGNLLNARLDLRDADGVMAIRRGMVEFGVKDRLAAAARAKKQPSKTRLPAMTFRSKSGIWLAGNVPELSIEGWDSVIKGTTKTSPALRLAGVNLGIKKLTGYGQNIRSLKIDSVKRGDGLALQLVSDAVNGEVIWLPRGFQKRSKFSARLRNLYLTKDEQAEEISPSDHSGDLRVPEKPGKTSKFRPGKLPALEIVIEDLRVKERQFGRFELVGHPDGEDWRLRRLNVANPDVSVGGDGVWRSVQGNTQTDVNLQLKLSDVGKTLALYGYPNTVKGGTGKLAANLTWTGSPDEFNNDTLNGSLSLDTGKGRFLKMEPGAGKLLSILSLQALPGRVTLDFTDVFSAGFQFDNIKGNATIKDGVIDTQDLNIAGSSAKITLKGAVNLNNGTQDLRVKVYPTLGDSVSLISAFAAGPAIGVGTLVFSKVLGDPLDKLVSFEYNVSGTWNEPLVTKVVKTPVPYK